MVEHFLLPFGLLAGSGVEKSCKCELSGLDLGTVVSSGPGGETSVVLCSCLATQTSLEVVSGGV